MRPILKSDHDEIRRTGVAAPPRVGQPRRRRSGRAPDSLLTLIRRRRER